MNMLSATQNQNQAAAAPVPLSRVQGALNCLHSEVSHLEDMASALEQKLISVLEPDNTKDTQGSTATPPMPTHVTGIIEVAELRVGAVRGRINSLLDRLHV